jgi:protein-tyrosine phosphatase
MEENGPLFRDFFAVLAREDSYPVLFHCSAGKDRTGILTALLLEMLGTPREVIYDDYLHSMRITPALKVDRTWMDAVFEAVDARGGIEPFLESCGVSREQRDRVRRNLGAEG